MTGFVCGLYGQILYIYRLHCVCLDVLATENRTLELHSPDGVHSCVLRASDASEAAAWFNTLHSALCVLNLQALQEANRALGAIVGELQHIGWLARKPATTEVSALLYYYYTIWMSLVTGLFFLVLLLNQQ